MAGKKSIYFDILGDMAEYVVSVTDSLSELINAYNATKLPSVCEQVLSTKRALNIKSNVITEKLYKDFLPPLEREDIFLLTKALVSAFDAIKTVFFSFQSYHILSLRQDVKSFSDSIKSIVTEMSIAVKELYDYKKSVRLSDALKALRNIHEEEALLCFYSVKKVFTNTNNALYAVSWNELYNNLRNVFDKISQVADSIERLILNNN